MYDLTEQSHVDDEQFDLAFCLTFRCFIDVGYSIVKQTQFLHVTMPPCLSAMLIVQTRK